MSKGLDPIDAAAAMRALGWAERDRLIAAGAPTVVDGRHRWLACSVTALHSPGGDVA